jgi:serpin B
MFALELYRKLARTPGNVFCSPYSIEVALAMVAAGAAGRTRDELVAALGVADPLAAHEGLRAALATRDQPTANELAMAKYMSPPPESHGCLLTIANAMWHQIGYPVAAPFVAAMRDRLGAEVREVDFSNTEAARQQVNAWAAAATRDRIREVLSTIPPLTRVLLANAVYFKARWAEQFFAPGTRPMPFTTGGGSRVDVPTMQVGAYFRYAKLSATEVVELPYTGGAISMLVMLPVLGGLGAFERVVDLDRVATALTQRRVTLSMPKFRVESSFMLGDTLRELGIRDAFSPAADFTPVSSEPGFALSDVIHKTYVDVDERGTEAAAVTMPMLAGAGPPRDVVEMHVDRPFVFAIVDKPTNTILFMGRVEDPR